MKFTLCALAILFSANTLATPLATPVNDIANRAAASNLIDKTALIEALKVTQKQSIELTDIPFVLPTLSLDESISAAKHSEKLAMIPLRKKADADE